MGPDTFHKAVIHSMVLQRTTSVPGLCFPSADTTSPEPSWGVSLPLQITLTALYLSRTLCLLSHICQSVS